MPAKIFLVAGEASADRAAASLIRDLRKDYPQAEFYGIGGKESTREGMKVEISSDSINVVGISDWFGRAHEVLISYKKACKIIDKTRPDLAILIDLPDFNLRLAKRLKKLGVPVFYYFSPQVWAWRKNRLKQIKERVDQMMVVFPFEEEIYRSEKIPVTLVEHPLLQKVLPRKRYRDQAEIQSAPRIGIMPGSRKSEVVHHADLLKQLINRIQSSYPKAEIKVPIASTLSKNWVKEKLSLSDSQMSEDAGDVLYWADLAVIASGTATLEAALSGLPFCLFYKISRSSAWLFKNVVKYQGFLGMPNILTQSETVKEFFQNEATPSQLFEEIDRLIKKGPVRLQMVSRLLQCRSLLGERGKRPRASQVVSNIIEKKS